MTASRADESPLRPFLPRGHGDPRAEYDALGVDCGWFRALGESLLFVEGPDAEAFLQAMLTQDVTAIADGRAQPAALADRKGHWLADLWVLRNANRFSLRVRGERAGVVEEVFARHRFAERVNWRQAGCSGAVLLLGPAARARLRALGIDDARGDREGGSLQPLCQGEWMQVREISSADVAIFAEAGDGERVVETLGALPEPPPEVGARAVHLRRIEAGTPWFGLDGDESRLVPEIVPEDRVSFSKGCFLGQETIARVHWRGRVRRRLALVLLDASLPPRRDLPLRDPQGAVAGSLLSAARRFDGRVIALALREAEAASDEVIAEDGTRGRWLSDPGEPRGTTGGGASQ